MQLAFCLLFVGPEPSQCGTSREHIMAGSVRPGHVVTPLGSTGRTWPGQGTRLAALLGGHVPRLGEGREDGKCNLEEARPSLQSR